MPATIKKAHVRRDDSLFKELRGVTRAEPGGEVAGIFGPRLKGADADAHELQPGAFPIHPAQCLAKDLAHTVIGIRTDGHVGADLFRARIEPDSVDGGGKSDPPHARLSRRFEDVVGTVHVHVADALVGVLIGDTAEVDDGVDALHRRAHLVKVGQIGEHDLLAFLRGAQVAVVGEAKDRKASPEMLAQGGAHLPGGSGDEEALDGAHPSTSRRSTFTGCPTPNCAALCVPSEIAMFFVSM